MPTQIPPPRPALPLTNRDRRLGHRGHHTTTDANAHTPLRTLTVHSFVIEFREFTVFGAMNVVKTPNAKRSDLYNGIDQYPVKYGRY